MLTHLDTLMPVNLADPVNRQHPLNQGRSCWWLTLPELAAGKFWFDLFNNTNGTLTSMTTAGSTGWSRSTRRGGWGALQFNGSSSNISLPGSNALAPANTITVSAWVMLSSTGAVGYIISKDNLSSSHGYSLRYDSASTAFVWYVGNASGVCTSTTVPVVNTWYHLTGTYDKVNTRLYVNGKQEASAATTVGFGASVGAQIGATNAASPGNYAGWIDDVSIWSRALSALEAFDLYNLSQTGYPGLLNRWPQRMVDSPTALTLLPLFSDVTYQPYPERREVIPY